MKVSAVTTWPPYREGVALYSAKLYTEIAKYAQVEIVANKTTPKCAGTCKATSIVLFRSWTRGSPLSLLQIFSMLMKAKASLIHLQHGWFLYGKSLTALLFSLLILLLRLSRKPVIVTMHTVIRRDAQYFKKKTLNIIVNTIIFTITKSLVTFASKVIVHNALMKITLEKGYNCKKNKVIVIPHGVDKAKRKNHFQKISQRKNKSLEILSLGFIRESKRLELLLNAFQKLHLNYPKTRLLIVGGNHPHDKKYAKKFKALVNSQKFGKEIALLNYLEESLLNKIVDNSEIVVLLSVETNLVEASGALARVADFEKPIICSRVPKFQSELVDGYDCVMINLETPEEIYDALESLIKDKETRKRIASNLKKKFSNRYWSSIAKKHVKLYHSFSKVCSNETRQL